MRRAPHGTGPTPVDRVLRPAPLPAAITTTAKPVTAAPAILRQATTTAPAAPAVLMPGTGARIARPLRPTHPGASWQTLRPQARPPQEPQKGKDNRQ